ncbi:centrosomal protein of 135 kDa-like isoform X1 [Phycodurus eques]|uniref:centrosomal protein of 135 kDa-like isoform X1 n=1 Tax=Phycodurus eques TaxID=693459 RepID=UPI002ACD6858|nr:centrosomal protein of 135 kDa-like isoform X1 [Phycodurus eques]
MTMDGTIDKTRSHLIKRLDQLGYRLHLGMDSVPLVAKLFSDLVHTTVSLRDAKLSGRQPERNHDDDLLEPPYRTMLASGDHFISGGGKKRSIALMHKCTQTDEDRPLPPPRDDDEADLSASAALIISRLVELLEEHVVSMKSELDDSHGRVKTLNGQLAELQEAKRTLERTLEDERRRSSAEAAELASRNEETRRELRRKDGAVARTVALKERVLNMAYRKLSASREVILSQQEVIQDLEENLRKIQAEVSERRRLREQLDEARGRNHKLEGLLDFLEAEKSALQNKVDTMTDTHRDLVLESDSSRGKYGDGDGGPALGVAAFIESLEEERNRYRREVQSYRSLLKATTPTAPTVPSPTQARRNKFVLAATFQADAAEPSGRSRSNQ